MAKNYPAHALLSFGGHLGTNTDAPEEWSCNLRIGTFDPTTGELNSPKNIDVEAQENYLDDHVDQIKTWFQSGNANITAQAKLTWVKFNAIAPDGKYYNQNTTSLREFSPILGGHTLGDYFKPFQVSYVVSLRTDRKRGLASKGRIYVPCPAGTVSENGRWIHNSQAATAFSNLVQQLNTLDALNAYRLCVLSPGKGTKGADNKVTYSGPGALEWVETVAVGDVLDTQRRRRNKLTENYSVVTP